VSEGDSKPNPTRSRCWAVHSDTRAEFTLLDERRFSNGVVYLRYRTPF
jgi:hypothetical protein